MHEDEFEPRLGRMRANGSKRTQKYLSMVVAAARRSGARSGIRNRRFDGSRIGRGASLARVLASGDRHAAFRLRRVVLKTGLVTRSEAGRVGNACVITCSCRW